MSRNPLHLLGLPIAALAMAVPLTACGSPSANAEAEELTIEEILDRHVEAVGGAAAIDAIESIRLSVHVVEPEFTVDGAYRATQDGLMRVDIYMDGQNVFTEGIDSAGAWQQGGAGAEINDIDGNPAEILARGVDFNLRGLHDLEGRGHSADLYGREEVDGINYYVVHVTFADGFERYYYINPENWMVERHRETSALHPDLNPEERPAETIFSDFVEQCGVLQSTASRKIDIETGEEIQNTRQTEFACNVDPATMNIERDTPPVQPALPEESA